ncbi:MAG: transglycosylase family protein [Acidimicrobiia bacterium]
MVDQPTMVIEARHQPSWRAVIAVVTSLFVGLFALGVAFSAEPVAGGATARRAKAIPTAARVPIEAALVSRARAEAEQQLFVALVQQQEEKAAAIEAAVAEYYRPKTGVNWDGIAQCETGGNWRMQGSSFSGGVGFYNGTWTGFGGRQFAPNAGMATREQQIVVAERVYARFGLSGWGCRAYG